MKSISKVIISLLALTLSCIAIAEVERGVLTTAIENREPVDDLGEIVIDDDAHVQQVFFFTQVKQLDGKQIIHRWFYRDREMAAVTLNIGSNNWRTYSSKRLRPQWLGEWRVEVWQGDLKMVEHKFEYKAE